MGYPGPHPDPPPDLANLAPVIYVTRQSWFRIHPIDREPLYFGRAINNRFDAPGGEYGVLYLAQNEHCAFIETFGQATGIRAVTTSSLSRKGLARVETSRDIRLIDFVSTGGLTRIGADGRLCDGDHQMSRRWSKALRDHPSQPDGLYYRARHDPSLTACALFDHVADALTASKLGALSDPRNADVLADILNTYGFSLIPS
jgi:hypothetical protein